MIRRLLEISIHHPGIVIAAAMLLTLLTLERLRHVGLDIFPEFAPKQVVVQIEAVGLSAQAVEQQVTVPLEQLLLGLPEVHEIRSQSIPGLSVITLTYGEDTDLERVRQQVSVRLAQAKLPPAVGPPVVVPLSSSAATVMTLGITSGKRSLLELRDWTERMLLPQLLATSGVADVNVFGGGERVLQVRLDPDALTLAGLGLNQMARELEALLEPRPLGFLKTANQELLLNLDLHELPKWLEEVAVGGIPLREVAEVKWGERVPISRAQIEGRSGLILMVIGQRGESIWKISRQIEEKLKTLEKEAKRRDIELKVLFRPADYIERAFKNLARHLIIGALLVVVVGASFLRDLRATIISLVAIPLSLLAAAVVMVGLGSTLNLMVLGGLVIAIGEVVDDAIIDVENLIRKWRERSDEIKRLTLAACLEVRSSVVYATLIVALVFTPIYAVEGVIEDLFAPLASAYIAAVLASLFIALTVTPALSVLLLRPPPRRPSPLARRLIRVLERLLRKIAPLILPIWALMFLLTAVLLWNLKVVETRLLPPLNEGHFILHTTMLPGTNLERTLDLGKRLIHEFQKLPEVVSVSQWSGRAERGADTFGSFYSEYEIRLNPLSGEMQEEVQERIEAILERFPGLEYEINTFLIERINETLSGYTADLVVAVTGPNWQISEKLLAELSQRLRAIPQLKQLRHHTLSRIPQLELMPDLQALARHRLTPKALKMALETAYLGFPLGTVAFEGRQVPVEVILNQEGTLAEFETLPLKADVGIVPLGGLVTLREEEVPYQFLHRGGERWQVVSAQIRGDFDEALQKVVQAAEGMVWPAGYRIEIWGAAFEQQRLRRDLLFYALLAGGAVLLLIDLALGHLRATLLTLLNLPLALIGGVVAVLLGQNVISIGSLVGFITLFGITVRNTIMLLSRYLHHLSEGQPATLETAILAAKERVVAIAMTGLITAGAMLPLALEPKEAGLEILGPMAQVIIGGLLSSTFLTVILMPPLLPRWIPKRQKSSSRDSRS